MLSAVVTPFTVDLRPDATRRPPLVALTMEQRRQLRGTLRPLGFAMPGLAPEN